MNQQAQAIGGEIVGADSRQVYRYMDIGTAKPTAEEYAQAPHHLIDCIDPDDQLSVARYQEMAYAAIDAVHARGAIPLLVGGTGQYITAVTEGWTIPRIPPDEPLRRELETFAETKGVRALHNRLQLADPETAAKLHPNNVRRVVRALEVYLVSGQPISVLQRKKPPPYAIVEHGLTMERQSLYGQADRRVDKMVEAGFLEEVRCLLEMGYDRRLPSLSSLGYQQLVSHLEGEISLEEAVQSTKTATHNFIRRQYAWFRGHDQGILWHNVEHEPVGSIINTIRRSLNR